MAKEKNELITQNKELIDKLKTKSEDTVHMKSLEDILVEEEQKENLDFYIKENQLLNEEINGLKEQLIAKGKDLNEVNKLNEENYNLKIKNEEIKNENEIIKNQLEEYKKQEIKNKLFATKKLLSESIIKLRSVNKDLDKNNYEKQINAIKKLKEEEKENYENQIKKMRMELTILKMKNKSQEQIIKNTKEKIKNLSLKNNHENINANKINQEKEQNLSQNYFVYAVLVFALIVLFFLDTKM